MVRLPPELHAWLVVAHRLRLRRNAGAADVRGRAGDAVPTSESASHAPAPAVSPADLWPDMPEAAALSAIRLPRTELEQALEEIEHEAFWSVFDERADDDGERSGDSDTDGDRSVTAAMPRSQPLSTPLPSLNEDGSARSAFTVPPTPAPLSYPPSSSPPSPHEPQQVSTSPSPSPVTPFARWLRWELERRSMTLADLADACGLARSTVTKWGTRGATPTPATCHKIADYFHYDRAFVLLQAGYITAEEYRAGGYAQPAPGWAPPTSGAVPGTEATGSPLERARQAILALSVLSESARRRLVDLLETMVGESGSGDKGP